MKGPLRSVLIYALGIGLCAGAFFSCFERDQVELPVGYSLEALSNPYLAYGRLLERMGHQVRIVDGPSSLDVLPLGGGTLIYPVERLTLSAPRSQRLLRWVESGGHLWVVSWSLWDDRNRRADPILDAIGVRQYRNDLEADAEDESPSDGGEVAAEDPPEELEPEPDLEELFSQLDDLPLDLARLWLGNRALEVQFDAGFRMEVEGEPKGRQIAGEHGIHLVQLHHGRGLITASTDDRLLQSLHLAEADHAEAALRLTRPRNLPGNVWIVTAESWPSVLELAREHAWAAGSAALVLVIAWLWRVSPHFGPLLPAPEFERRSLLEHIEASGRLLWRGRRQLLLEAARDALQETLRRRHPGWLRLPPRELHQRLADSAELDALQANEALGSAPAKLGALAFTRAVANLERIRKSL